MSSSSIQERRRKRKRDHDDAPSTQPSELSPNSKRFKLEREVDFIYTKLRYHNAQIHNLENPPPPSPPNSSRTEDEENNEDLNSSSSSILATPIASSPPSSPTAALYNDDEKQNVTNSWNTRNPPPLGNTEVILHIFHTWKSLPHAIVMIQHWNIKTIK